MWGPYLTNFCTYFSFSFRYSLPQCYCPHTTAITLKVTNRCSHLWLCKGGKFFFFVLRKKGSKTKERMKEEEIEKGDCGPPTRKVFFLVLSDLNQAVPNHLADESQTMVRWCIRLTRLTLVCEVIRYRLVQVRQNKNKKRKKKKKREENVRSLTG